MDFESVLEYLAKVKSLGFREFEVNLPVPEEEEYAADVPHEQNFGELLSAGQPSFHQALALSQYPYGVKGSLSFSLLANELGQIVQPLSLGSAKAPGKGAKALYFTKISNSGKPELLDAISKGNAEWAFESLPAKATTSHEIEKIFAVHSDGREVQCFMRFGKAWKRIFSMPFSPGTWHVQEKEFVAAYALGKNLYGSREFNPSLENVLFAATRRAQYGWAERELEVGDLLENAAYLAQAYSEAHRTNAPNLRDFTLLLALSHKAAFSSFKETSFHSAEFFANIPYMLAKAELEKSKGNLHEALFLLRSVEDACMLCLRCAPLGGRMLQLSKYFDDAENFSGRRFVLSKSVLAMLASMGVDLQEPDNDFIKLRRGKSYFVHGEKISMDFGMLLAVLRTASFFREEIKADAVAEPELWKELRSHHAKLFVATYGKENALELLADGSDVPRGADILKVEEFFSKLVVKRSMAFEGGKAKEIKPHLAKIISIGDKRSLDERSGIEEMGSWGEAVYEIAAKEKKAVLALVHAKRFY